MTSIKGLRENLPPEIDPDDVYGYKDALERVEKLIRDRIKELHNKIDNSMIDEFMRQLTNHSYIQQSWLTDWNDNLDLFYYGIDESYAISELVHLLGSHSGDVSE